MSTRAKTLRLVLYRWILKSITPWLDPRKGDQDLWFSRLDKENIPTSLDARNYYWIHAASAGELESLEPVALALAKKDIPIVLTVFSPSAKVGFLKLREQLKRLNGVWMGGGLSPFEGGWGEIFKNIPPPQYFITAKYEAWPELWASALEYDFPILIVGAQARSSLTWAGRILRVFLGLRLPRLLLAAFDQPHLNSLIALRWNSARVVQVRDPRWDAVLHPSQVPERAKALLDWAAMSALPRPWGMVGNSWMSDFTRVPSLLQNEQFARTLWVIPHEVRGAELDAQELLLNQQGFQVLRSSEVDLKSPITPAERGRICILVDEIGILKHLYSKGDFIFVGGGYGRGLHNVMEPAVGGALVFAGPAGADRFAEIPELEKRGQLTIIRDEADFIASSAHLNAYQCSSDVKTQRREELGQLSGGTSDVLSALFGA